MTISSSITDNPFATRHTRPGALPFQFPKGACAELLIARLHEAGWRGQIVGAHGSGKSTLLVALLEEFQSRGIYTRTIALHDGQRRLPFEFLRFIPSDKRVLLVVDGYEQLSTISKQRLRWRCWWQGWGLLVTTHSLIANIPVLISLSPNVELMGHLLKRLLDGGGIAERQQAEFSFLRHNGNLREVWFDLYDRHERTCSRIGRKSTFHVSNRAKSGGSGGNC